MKRLIAAILDVDGVLLASPHEQAWREALTDFGDPAWCTSTIYRSEVAEKSRLDGAIAALFVRGVGECTGASAGLRYAQTDAIGGADPGRTGCGFSRRRPLHRGPLCGRISDRRSLVLTIRHRHAADRSPKSWRQPVATVRSQCIRSDGGPWDVRAGPLPACGGRAGRGAVGLFRRRRLPWRASLRREVQACRSWAWPGAARWTRSSPSATEFSVHIRAYNMKRVMAVLGTKPLMDAIIA